MATISWTLCVCGDVKKIFGVLAEETDTVLNLKKTIQHKSRIPSAEQTLYFQEKLMGDDQTLCSYPGLGDGAVIYLVRRPLSLRIYNLLQDTPNEFSVTLGHDIKDQSVSVMKKVICEIAYHTNLDSCMLLCAGEVLEDQAKVGDYPGIESGARITLQKSPVSVKLKRHGAKFTATMPQGINSKFVNKWVSVKTGETESQVTCGAYSGLPSDKKDQQLLDHCTITRQPGWVLSVQGLDGNKISVCIPEKWNTPIVKLKEIIEKRTDVPTHHQRLTIGTTVLEDWDKDNNMMFIGDYPAIQNGSLLYIVQHDGNFRVFVGKQRYDYSDGKMTINLHGRSEYNYQTTQFYVNTSEAEAKTVFAKIQKCSNLVVANIYDQHHRKKEPRMAANVYNSRPYDWNKFFGGSYYQHQVTTTDNYDIEPNDMIQLCDH